MLRSWLRSNSFLGPRYPKFTNTYSRTYCSVPKENTDFTDTENEIEIDLGFNVSNNSSVKEVHNLIKEGNKARFQGKYHNLLCLYKALKKKTSLSKSIPYYKTKKDLFQFVLQRKVLQRNVLNELQVQIQRSNVKAEATLKDVEGSNKAITFPKLPLDMQNDPSLVGLDYSGSGFTSFHFLLSYRSCYQVCITFLKSLSKAIHKIKMTFKKEKLHIYKCKIGFHQSQKISF